MSSATERLPALLARPRGVLLYGAIAAVVYIALVGFVIPFPWTMQTARVEGMLQTKAAIDKGAPPLLRVVGGHYEPSGPTDDQGGYVLVPEIAHAVGTDDVVGVMKWCSILAFALLVLMAPFVFGR